MSHSLLLLAKATLLLVLAMGIAVTLRRAPAGARYLVWLASFVALLMVPAISAWSPLPLPILPSEPTGVAATSTGLVIWLGAAGVLLAWLALGGITVRRVVRNARALTDAVWLNMLYETADRLDLAESPRLVMSSKVEMPFACGVRRPTIVLPASAEQWSEERRRVVLLHELAHIKRRDLFGHTVGRVVCAVYWFHPLVWSAARQMRAESERACDDLVLASGARPSDYANHLLEIVTRVRGRAAPALALPMANKREFEGRMLAILDPEVKRTAPNRVQRAFVTLGFGAVSLSIMAVAPMGRTGDTASLAAAPIIARAPVQPSPTRSTAKARPEPAGRTEAASSASAERRAADRATQIPGPQPPNREPADTALLGPILRTDVSDIVRRSVAWQLQGHREGVPLLLDRLQHDPSWRVREMAAWGLAGFASDSVSSALAGALRQDNSIYVRATSAWALGYSHSEKIDDLVAALDDDYQDARRKAAWSLARSGLTVAPAGLIAALRDRAPDVRAMTAWSLAEIGDKAALPALRDAFLVERDHEAAMMQFRALASMGEKSNDVIERAIASTDSRVRARAVRLLAGDSGGPWILPIPMLDVRPQP